jgi:hypothetical protein
MERAVGDSMAALADALRGGAFDDTLAQVGGEPAGSRWRAGGEPVESRWRAGREPRESRERAVREL